MRCTYHSSDNDYCQSGDFCSPSKWPFQNAVRQCAQDNLAWWPFVTIPVIQLYHTAVRARSTGSFYKIRPSLVACLPKAVFAIYNLYVFNSASCAWRILLLTVAILDWPKITTPHPYPSHPTTNLKSHNPKKNLDMKKKENTWYSTKRKIWRRRRQILILKTKN